MFLFKWNILLTINKKIKENALFVQRNQFDALIIYLSHSL